MDDSEEFLPEEVGGLPRYGYVMDQPDAGMRHGENISHAYTAESATDKCTKSTPKANLQSRQGPSLEASDPNVYNMTYPKRGLAIIINNRNFQRMKEREGTDVDAEALKRRFQELEFDVRMFRNSTAAAMKTVIKNAAANDHTDSDCFVCAVLSHGGRGIVYGVDDKSVEIEELTRHFKEDCCRTLAGKPKLFFIQACRGRELDDGVEVTDAPDEGDPEQAIPVDADFLIAYSVAPGYFSWRNSEMGSYFVQALSEVLKNENQLDVMTMMTRVSRKVAYEFQSKNLLDETLNRKKQIPSIVSLLTKDLYLSPKIRYQY